MNWDDWAHRFEATHGPDDFAALFAPGGRFKDPVTDWTTDVRKVATDTDAIFPDWTQTIDRIRGTESWAVFEWTGRATFLVDGAEDGATTGIPIVMTGATVIEIDGNGLITSWRDYLDTNEPTQQIQAGLAAATAADSDQDAAAP